MKAILNKNSTDTVCYYIPVEYKKKYIQINRKSYIVKNLTILLQL